MGLPAGTDQATPADDVPLEVVVGELRRLQADGAHAVVLARTAPLLARFPENRDLLLLAARSLRLSLRTDDALAMLVRLGEFHPQFSRRHEEEGLCRVAARDAPGAVAALLRAVHANPALPLSWQMLEGLYRLTGDTAGTASAATQRAILADLPPEVVAATALFADGDWAAAEAIVRPFLQTHGDHPEAMRLLARIGVARDVLDDAELLFAAMLDRVPDHRRARFEFADCLLKRQKYAAARDQIERLLAADPDDADTLALRATAAVGLGDQATAIAIYHRLLTVTPGASDLHLWLGHALKTVGRLDQAVAAYRAAAALRPDFGDAYWSLANLKTFRFDDAEIARMRVAEAAAQTATGDRLHLCFALGKALEDRRDFADSWTFYARGNALKRAESGYLAAVLETNTALQTATCTPAFFARRTGWGDARPDPIFVVGLPRSGSTLIEQILASHSQVEGTQELADIQAIVHDLHGREIDFAAPRYPHALTELTAADCAAFGARYLADTQAYRTGRPFFVDKMPNNFRHIGLIHLILPKAKIIDARRSPLACCFSNLKQLFAQGQEFAYSVEDIARYYRTYVELMAHWDAALPGRVLRVQHEDVIDDLEASVRRILAYCALDFEPACVAFHTNKRSVRTPSAEQVRQPIYRDGLDQWRNYAPWLGELQRALGDV